MSSTCWSARCSPCGSDAESSTVKKLPAIETFNREKAVR